ncbi:MAG: 4-(cytidine 5'-diphospho)-2-C-methyl-D-erythritol kinase [Crocinitomicaceae bacterium]|nr:4-(cytidine 5'-diphospho)-2-C-methyl-D-erythritol kinase [Crocinitomicaceae bacterium]
MIYFPNAKINFGLRVLGHREDGFHNIQSAFIPVGWSDILEVNVLENGTSGSFNFSIIGNEIEGDDSDNLVVRAHGLLSAEYNLPEITATLLKNIPSGAGLGGGSSDGSFMLKAINDICRLGLNSESLEQYAAKLGSDCPFFIKNEPSLVTGRGEKLSKFNCPKQFLDHAILIIFPSVGVSTAEAFSLLDSKDGEEIDFNDTSTIVNDFQNSIINRVPEVAEAIKFHKKNGANFVQMTGTGSAVFGLYSKENPQLKIEAEERGWRAYLGAFL